MTIEQCRAKVASLLAEADGIDLADSQAAFRAQAAYLLEWADEVERAGIESRSSH